MLDRCRSYCPVHHIPAKKGEDRALYDSKLTAKLLEHGVEVVLCVGWMRIFSKEFCQGGAAAALTCTLSPTEARRPDGLGRPRVRAQKWR